MNNLLIQVTTSVYCAGIIVKDGYIIKAAPILHWTIGKKVIVVKRRLLKQGVKWVILK